MINKENTFEKLTIIDPELAETVFLSLQKKERQVSYKEIELLEEETIWAMCQDIELGTLIALGYAGLIGDVKQKRLDIYRDVIHVSCKKGLNLGRMMAAYWVPVLRYGDEDIIKRFPDLLNIMRKRGEYSLKKPLNALSSFLEKRELRTALAFMGLLFDTFSQELPYKQTLHLSRLIPKIIQVLPPEKRNWQISRIRQVIRTDYQLADPFLNAMEKHLYLLSEQGLRDFVKLGLEKYGRSERAGMKFLSLDSKPGMDAYKELLVTVSLAQVRGKLNRYLQARTGLGLSAASMSAMPRSFLPSDDEMPLVCSDGKSIYLSDEISLFPNKDENEALYKCLTKLEAALYEFKTFDFDLEKALHRCGISPVIPEAVPSNLSDMENFFHMFPIPALASDLFMIFEHGRIRLMLNHFYPGIVRSAFPYLQSARLPCTPKNELLLILYRIIALGDGRPFDRLKVRHEHIKKIINIFEKTITHNSPVEACAELVFKFYPEIEKYLVEMSGQNCEEYMPFKPPFGRRLRPDLVFAGFHQLEQTAKNIKIRLEEKGITAYKSDIKKQIMEKQGRFSINDLKEIVLSFNKRGESESVNPSGADIDLSWLDLSEILGKTGIDIQQEESTDCPVFWYKEWDFNMGDYLHEHTRVLDKFVPEIQGDMYELALERHYGLVRSIRRAFERLRPEGLSILRQWVEGDEFDYRALLDYAIDRKAGIMPSDRLYIKRIKQQRDVAVMLLVDISKSTANKVFESDSTVLDVEKEAIVLFCEALEVVGDAFAIAGFSGTGRLSVDYFRIKDFHEQVTEEVKARINGMSPQRSTRMGAAIRHAAAQLEKVSAKVRILIVLGDGFPNDTDYKREYAIADTRKAISEARSENIHARAITVNIMGDSRLDDLYGSMHHNVISDVRELPDKLLRIYSSLTK